MNFKTKKGLRLPITGEPEQNLDMGKDSKHVAVLGSDFVGMRPTMLVKVGDEVKLGQALFSCKKNIGVTYTSPGAGKVVAVNRGERRVFQSMVIELSSNEEQVSFKSYSKKEASDFSKEEVQALLLESGEWTHIRQRPFEKVAPVNTSPKSIFITAMDTNPLAPEPSFVTSQYKDEFRAGVEVLSKLTSGKTYVVSKTGDTSIEVPSVATGVSFQGPHPAGNVGTHIHFVDPVNPNESVWHVGYQGAIAIGKLFLTGELHTDRLVTLAGPRVKSPRYLKLRRGAKLSEVLSGELHEGANRVISGSVFSGFKAHESFDYLGAYSNQITVIEEDTKRELLGWHSPGFNKFSVKNIYLSKLIPGKKFAFGSNTNGSLRAMVPIESFENLMPLDIIATPLLKALASKDTDHAQDLGCLELAEEDLALMTFAAPGKVDFGVMLRENLTTIEKEG